MPLSLFDWTHLAALAAMLLAAMWHDATMRRIEKAIPRAAYEVLEEQSEEALAAALARLEAKGLVGRTADADGHNQIATEDDQRHAEAERRRARLDTLIAEAH